jgi:hypothetical protein
MYETTPYFAKPSRQFCAAQAKAILHAAAATARTAAYQASKPRSLYSYLLRNIKEKDGRKEKNEPLLL